MRIKQFFLGLGIYSLLVVSMIALEVPDNSYLLLKSADVSFRTKGKTFKATIRYPEVKQWDLRNSKDLMRMYLRVIDEKNPGRIHWVHFSQMKSADFRWVVPGSPPNGRGVVDHQSSRRLEPDRKTEVTVNLNNGTTIKGWMPDAMDIYGIGDRGRPGYDTCGNFPGPPEDNRFYLASITPTSFVTLDSGGSGRDNSVETPNYESLIVKSWRDNGLKGEDSGAGVKDISLEQAADIYNKHRSQTQGWVLKEGGKSSRVDLCKINFRYTTHKGRGKILIGGYFVKSLYESIDNWKAIDFSSEPERVEGQGNVRHAVVTITAADGSKKTKILPLFGNPEHDYVAMWKTDYGFAGASIFPLRKVSLRRTE